MAYTNTQYNFGEVVQEICRLVGHPVPVSAASSTDQAVQQMRSAVNQALKELLKINWQELQKRDSISVVAASQGQEERAFAMPDDFERFIDQTQWGSTSLLPAAGPVLPQAWMMYVVRDYAPQLTLAWQLREQQLYVLAPPYPDAATFEFMYISKAMVYVSANTANTSNVAVNDDDTFVLDDNLILLLSRAKYLEMKGFDSSGAMRDYLNALDEKIGANKGAPILNIGRPMGLPLIDPMTNLPDTGYGV